MKVSDNEAALGCITLIPVIVASVLIKAWALTTIWNWFITPAWGISAPSKAVALGLSALISMMVGKASSAKDPDISIWATYAEMLLSPVFSVGFAWCVKTWM